MLTATPAKQNQVERPRQACFSFSLTQTVCFSVLRACGDPGKPDNAIVVSQSKNYWTGQYVRYLCNPGYAMVGPAVRRCLVSGKWSGNVPTCKS